jgi:SH3-like domain-containing protein
MKQKKKIVERNSAIVFCPRVTVKSAPAQTGTDLFLIYEGLKVQITDSIDTWKEIKLADGNQGWLQDSCIVKI